jgi:hypothetical protein
MEINNKKLLFAISFIALVVIIIQLNVAFGSNLEENNISMVENNNNLDNNKLEIDEKQNQATNSMNINTNTRVTSKSDITVYEGEPISLKPIVSNAIALPAKSLLYSWNQIEGPKINLTEEDKKNKMLNFIAPNLPSDTKYAFEVKVAQKNLNGNIDLGNATISVLVVDTNKIAKGAGMNIPSTPSSSLPSTSSSPSASPPPNIPNNNGDDIVVDGGQFNPNFRD